MKKAAKSTVTMLFALVLMVSMFVPAFAASVGKVKSLKASKVTYNSVTLTWKAVSKVSGYSVEQYNTSKKKWAQVATTNNKTTTKTIRSLKTGTSYKFRVRAYSKNFFGKVTYGSYSSTLTAKPMPAKLTSLKATTTTSSVKLSWSTVSKATGYKVQVLSGKKWKDYKTIKGASAKSLTISKLKINTTYSYRVAAYNTVSKKTYIGAYTTVKAKTELKKPTLKASSITTTGAKISWGAVSEASGYKIESYANKKWTTLATIKSGKTKSYSFTKGVPGATYQLRISAYKTVSKKNYYSPVSSTLKFKTASVATPKNLSASSVTYTGAKITWSKVSGTNGYKLEINQNGKWSTLSTIKSYKTTSYTYTKGIPGTAYQVRIRAYKTVGSKNYYSSTSSAVSFTTTAAATPGSLSVSNGTYTGATFNWAAVSGVTGYKLEINNGGWKTLEVINGDSNTSYSFTGGVPGTRYQVRISSYKTVGKTDYYSAVSSAMDFTTASVAAPANFKYSEVTYTSAKFAWASVSGVDGYKLEINKGSNWETLAKNKNTSYSFSNAVPGTSYQLRVAAYKNVGGKEYYGPAASLTVKTPAIPTVSGLTVTANNSGAISLKWNAVSGASYVITGGPSEIKTNNTSATISGLNANTAYTFKVSAVISGYSSATQNAKTKTAAAKVEGVKAGERAAYSYESRTYMATLNWNAVPGAEGYVIHSDDKSLTDVTTTKTTGYVHYLRSCKIYTFTVRAFTTLDGKKIYSDISESVTVKTPLTAVARDSIAVSNEVAPNPKDAAVITWNPVAGASYIVEKYTQPGNGVQGGYVLAQADLKQAKFVVEGTPSFNVKAEKSGDYLTKISWEKQAGGDYTYDVEAANVKTGLWFNIGSTKGDSVTVRLAAGTKYIFRVIADYGNTQIKVTAKNAIGEKSGTTEKFSGLKYPLRYGISEEFTTEKKALANNNESKTQYALMAIEAFNSATHNDSKVTAKLVANIDSDLDDTRIICADQVFGIKTSYSIQGFIDLISKVSDEDFDFNDLLGNMGELGESSNLSGTFINGKGNVLIPETRYVFDEDGKRLTETIDGKKVPVTQEVNIEQEVNLCDITEPRAGNGPGIASLYDYNNVAAFANKISNVTSTQSGDKTTIKLVLKEEKTNGLSENPAPVHSGFFTNVASMFDLRDMGSDGSMTANISVGNNIKFKGKNYNGTEITYVLDKNGELEKYTVSSPYTISVSMGMNLDGTPLLDAMFRSVEINLVLKGVCKYDYTFTK